MSWIYNSRRFNHDFTKKFQTLIAKFNSKITDDNSADTGQELQSLMEGLTGRTYLLFYDTDLDYLYGGLDTTALSTIHTAPAFEPDGVFLKAYIEFDSVGGHVPDRSGFSHDAKVYGIGRIHKGIEYGMGTTSIETVFDGRSTYAEIPDSSDFAINTASSFSLQFRFLPFSLARSIDRFRQVVISKKDIYNVNTWLSFEFDFDGSCIFTLVVLGVIYRISTPAATIQSVLYGDITPTTPRIDVAITWDVAVPSAPVLKLYINNVAFTTVVHTLDASTVVPNYIGNDFQIGRFTDVVSNIVDSAFLLIGSDYTPPSSYTGNGTFVGPQTNVFSSVVTSGNKYPPRFRSKLYYGVFQQFKYWKNKVLTATEIGNHYTNKLTISNIAKNNVAIPEGVIILSL